jgi:hypothetical protein
MRTIWNPFFAWLDSSAVVFEVIVKLCVLLVVAYLVTFGIAHL